MKLKLANRATKFLKDPNFKDFCEYNHKNKKKLYKKEISCIKISLSRLYEVYLNIKD
jgi:hypothetical protein